MKPKAFPKPSRAFPLVICALLFSAQHAWSQKKIPSRSLDLKARLAPKPATGSNTEKEEWISLFDGKTLKQWEGKDKVFRVEDGSIVAGNLKEKIPNNEFLCTKKSYENFELRLKAKLIGVGKNAGIQFRSKRIPNHHEVIGYQCDMGMVGDRSIWGSLYDESRRRKFLADGEKTKTLKHTRQNEWNEFVIRCNKNRIQIWLNGFQTVDYTETDESIAKSGILGLQIHSGPPAEAWYKEIKIKILK